MLNCKLYERCMRTVCTMITCCILYLEAPNAKIKLFIDKEVTNWINNKLKDRKYHEVLTLTLEEFDEQKQNKKKRQEEMVKKQPKKGPEPKAGKEGECYTFIYSVPTACTQHAYSMLMHTLMLVNFFQLTHTSASYHLQITSIVQH